MSNAAARLFTFDIFGTVVDWRSGLRELDGERFDRCIDLQGEMEQRGYRAYTAILEESLVAVGVEASSAGRQARGAGRWPLHADSTGALRRLMAVAPCAAVTNSDRAHGDDVQRQLGFSLNGWICAEDVRAYKPDARMWRAAAKGMGVPFGRDWWHVSAYAHYDLRTARELRLTCVLVRRPHRREGAADVTVSDLGELADLVEK